MPFTILPLSVKKIWKKKMAKEILSTIISHISKLEINSMKPQSNQTTNSSKWSF
jgi:hypothetical protein